MSTRVETPPAAPAAASHEHHRDVQGGAVRAGVFGISDGLLTNVSLILGVAGGHASGGAVRLAGLAGLLAGAFSMAGGEYISMSAQSELIEKELDIERREIARHPESERRELVTIYTARGVDRDTAEKVASALMRDPRTALEVHAREELGVDPDSTGSPVAAALSSFVTFAFGALVPLLPWFFTAGTRAVAASIVLGAVMALLVGGALGHFSGRSRVRSALRQLGIAALAAAVTYAIGTVVGAPGVG